MEEIPIVDLNNIHEESEGSSTNPDWIKAAEKIRKGLGSVGFLYLVNHGIPEHVITSAMMQSKEFFDLPLEVKKQYELDTSSASSRAEVFDLRKFHGFKPCGGETLHPDGKFEMKETFDWQCELSQNSPIVELPNFNTDINQLEMGCIKLLKKFLKLLAMALRLNDANFFLKECKHLYNQDSLGLRDLRLLHYPPITISDGETLRGAVRCGEHSDYGFITLLFQDDVGGLEVKTVDGDWIDAKPIPGSILVNVGNLTEFWTGGILPATPHKIVIPEEEDPKRTKSRYSIAYFMGPDDESVITPMDMEKRPVEAERLVKNGKTYSKEPIKTYDYIMNLVAKQYT